MRIRGGIAAHRCAMRGGSGEPEHLALTLPVERQVGGAGETLSIELHRLTPVENGGSDVGSEVAEPDQHCKIVAGEPLLSGQIDQRAAIRPVERFRAQ